MIFFQGIAGVASRNSMETRLVASRRMVIWRITASRRIRSAVSYRRLSPSAYSAAVSAASNISMRDAWSRESNGRRRVEDCFPAHSFCFALPPAARRGLRGARRSPPVPVAPQRDPGGTGIVGHTQRAHRCRCAGRSRPGAPIQKSENSLIFQRLQNACNASRRNST